jgi:hypothetical protein
MDRKYWIGRMHAAHKMARHASTAESRLIHYDMAGRYSIKAANALPFLVRRKAPATVGEQAALRLPEPGESRSGPNPRPNPPARRKPGNDER